MAKIFARQKLSNEEREFLVLQHRRERDKRICDRIKAVLLRDEGWTYEQIAHVLLLTKEAIRQHVDDYEELHKLKGEYSGSEKGRFYRMAKRSATECAGIFEIYRRLELIEESRYILSI